MTMDMDDDIESLLSSFDQPFSFSAIAHKWMNVDSDAESIRANDSANNGANCSADSIGPSKSVSSPHVPNSDC